MTGLKQSEELASLTPAKDEKRKSLEEFIGMRWYAIIVYIASSLIILSTVMVIVFMVYAAATPTVVGCGDEIFPVDQKFACKRLHDLRDTGSNCTLQLLYQFEAVNIEFDLFCNDAIKVKTSTTWQMFAILIGAFLFGQLSDMYGRRRMLLIALSGIAAASVAVSFATSFRMFFIFRLVVGFFAGGTSAVHGVYIIEHSRKDHRMLISNVVTWSPNFAIAPIIAYFAHDWRTLSVYSAYVCILAFAILVCCSESPRFLIQKGRIDEARRVLSRIRSINRDRCEIRGTQVEEMLEIEREKNSNQNSKKHTTYFDLFTSTELLKYTLIIGFGVTVTSLQNYGIMFNTEKLSGSLYVNGIFFGAIRWVVNLIIGYLDITWSGCTRKRIAAFSKTTNLLCLAIIIAIFSLGVEQSFSTVIRIASITVFVFCGPIFTSMFLAASELYPTSVRNVGTSFQSMSARVGTIFGTTIFILAEIHMAVPYCILFALLVVDLFLFQCNIPETKGVELKDHITKRETSA
ncbi:hypothetical protein PENTCL1PPCAC_28982 [Pristionchus entomophagus]|uniref:Major facilitator superfamily (MFS) profile domain-containing protein n=1 Tax=Pristionchus entomophagus TaxID=358040 RepID=A0AAV5UKF8_9BILA|nr:hypothetical protein PENTCL1PPCAC_28982 [Pristionchus entomophagus]